METLGEVRQVQAGKAGLGRTRISAVRQARTGLARQVPVGYGRHGVDWLGMEWSGLDQHGRQGKARHREARCG